MHSVILDHIRRTLTAACLVLAGISPVAAADYYAGLDAYRAGDFEKAMAEWLPLARQGDAEAQYRVGRLYARGHGTERDDAEAADWFGRSARQGHASAQNDLGQLYEKGQGVEADDVEAVKWFRASAEKGRAVAQANLAMMYEQGRGVSPDEDAAARWYRRAALQGNARAQNSLGRMYESGRGVEADPSKAADWYRKSAKQDFAVAQFNLGRLFEEGRGVEQDRSKATKWYHRASQEGLIEAQERLDALYEEDAARKAAAAEALSNPTTRPDDSTAQGASPEADSAGSAAASPKASYDVRESASLTELRTRAEGGDAEAQHRLGSIYSTGQGVPPDPVEAGRWYRMAADQGHPMAGYHLAFMYYRGRGVAKGRDYVRAYMWFSISADQGIGDAAQWRDKIARKMSREEIVEADRLAAER